MKIFGCVILLFIAHNVSAQSWMDMINDPQSNYNVVEKSFQKWKDSAETKNSNSLLYRLFYHHKIEEQEEIVEEAQEHFYHWANERKLKMDDQGNLLSEAAQNQRYQDYLIKVGGVNQSLSQGSWFSRGPDQVNAPYSGSKGIGRANSIAVDPNDSNIVYAGSGNTLWKSINDGNTWSIIQDSLYSFYWIKCDPVSSNILYANVAGKLYKSTDAALTWNQIASGIASGYSFSLLIDPANNQNLILSGLTSGIYKSYDAGASWVNINSVNYGKLVMKPGNPNVLYAGGSYFYRSLDGGLTFTNTYTLSFTAGYGVNAPMVTEADSNYVYVGAYAQNNYGGQIAVSADGGTTFTTQPVSGNMLSYPSATDRYFDVSPVNKNLLFYFAVRSSRTTDMGQTWNYCANQYYYAGGGLSFMHVDVRNFLFNGSSIWCSTDGGVYKSQDNGGTWIDKSAGMSNSIFYSLASSETDTSVFIGGNLDNSTLVHASNGWTNAFSGDGYDVAIKPNDPLTIYGKNQYNFIRSFDGGVTQSPSPFFQGLTESVYGFQANHPVRFNQQNPNSMYLLVNNVWKSTNNGNTLSKISTFNPNGTFLYICNTDSNIIFTANHHTINNGSSWYPNSKTVFAVDPDEPNKLWSRTNNTVYFSSDTGYTWIEIPSLDLTNLTVKGMRCVNNIHNGVFLFSDYNVFYKDDRLSNWQPFNTALPYVAVSDMNVLSNAGIVRVSTLGRGVWQSSLFDSTQVPKADFIANKKTACPNDLINFYDNSLNNGPGYNAIYKWTFNGGTPSVSSASSTVVFYANPGTYSVSLKISNIYGSDSITKISYITVSPPPTISAPLTEGFEGSTFPPVNWNVNNYYSSAPIWNISPNYYFTAGGYDNSVKSLAYMNQSVLNTSDIFTMPDVDISTLSNGMLAFDYCYQQDTLFPDTLAIFYTTDCGITKNFIYTKGGDDLQTILSPGYLFEPDAVSWKSDSVNLNALSGMGSIQIGFLVNARHRAGIFIDNINIYDSPGNPVNLIDKTVMEDIVVAPNPTNGYLSVKYENKRNMEITIELFNMLGEKLFSERTTRQLKEFDLSNYNTGVYIISISGIGTSINKKLIISR
ncbi:MAG: T9SS type A sorting domain-containing protein [Bacteroidota bacterium]